MAKTAAAKRLAEEKGISVRESERWLNANMYLEEHHWWAPCRLHHQFPLQRMFLHAVAMGQKEYDYAICQCQQEPWPEWDLEVELSTVELICPTPIREESAEIYQDVYQQWRSPVKLLCDGETEELLCQEILDSIKECLQCKWVPTLLGEELSHHPTSTSRCDPQADYSAQNCDTYDQFKDMTQGSCEEALAVVRDAHQQALAATALLEDKIERLNLSLSCSCQCSGSHECSGSHRHSASHWWRSWTGSHQTKVPQVKSCQGSQPEGKLSPPTPCNWDGG